MKSQRIACLVAGTALALSTVFGAIKLAYAEGDTTVYSTAVITKELETVPGQDLDETFKFTFTPYGATSAANPTLDGTSVEIKTNDPAAIFKFDASKARVTYFGNTADLMDAIKEKFKDSKPGIYEYSVAETKGSTANMTYDKNTYFLRVIKNGDNDIKVQVIKPNEKGEPGDQKVDPTANKNKDVTSTGTGSDSYQGSDFVFKNSYKLGDDNAVMGKTLKLSKLVAGLEPAGTAYSFTVKFITPDAAKNTEITAAGADGAAAKFDNVDGTFNVTLKQGESVTFSNIQEGTLYSVTESTTGQFTPSAAIVTGAKTANLPAEATVTGALGNASGYTVDYNSTHRTIVGDGTNSATVTNTYTSVNPTGIIINNLPFILMVGIPVVAAAGYVVSRRKA